jgi:hypothetical protein
MFVLDATSDFEGALHRLARLMYNIETNSKIFEWKRGSPPEPRDGPLSLERTLTVTVPGTTKGAPPVLADYWPSTGFVYYVPSALDRDRLPFIVKTLSTVLHTYPYDHLKRMGHPTGVASFATLYTKHPEALYETKTALAVGGSTAAAARRIELYRPDESSSWAPSSTCHLSRNAWFTWFIFPIRKAFSSAKVSTEVDFNAMVSSVVLDTFLGGQESDQANYDPYSVFGIPRPPPELESLAVTGLRDNAETDGTIVVILTPQGIDFAPPILAQLLPMWHNYAATVSYFPTALNQPPPSILNLNSSARTEYHGCCVHCKAPLWGTVYVARHPHVHPHFVAFCRWCAGCLRLADLPSTEVYRYDSECSRSEALSETPFKPLTPLLEAKVIEIIENAAPPGGAFAIMELVGVRFILSIETPLYRPSTTILNKVTPLCLTDPQFRAVILPSYVLITDKLALVVEGEAPAAGSEEQAAVK